MSKGQEETDRASADQSVEEADDAAEASEATDDSETADDETDLSPAEARCLISLGESDES